MAEDRLTRLFFSKVKISEDSASLLRATWREKISLKRNQFLIRKGQVEHRLYFILEGTLRIYFPKDDEEICVGFGYPDTLICSFPSFIKGLPSDYYIQSLSSCKLLAIGKKDFEALTKKIPSLQTAWRLFLEEALLGKIERETEMLTYTPKERFEILKKRSPHVFELIPKKYIASYLRMAPETLSRITAKRIS